MEEKLQNVLKEYIRDVENVCKILLKNINDTEHLNLKNKHEFFAYRNKCKKMEFEADGIHYRMHGKGCLAYNEKMFIDWEFGYRSRWCGVDPWKVAFTLKENQSIYTEYYDGNLIRASCDLLTENNIMFKKYEQYYFKIPEDETFKPNFPIEYDTLMIEYSNFKWSIPRNKVIDRFIRKSNKIYNRIGENEDKCMLRFLLEGKEVYSIPYDDIGYPENAVKIMNHEIIQNLLKEKNFLGGQKL